MMQITVNGAVIGERQIAREMQYHPADSLEEARRKAAEALVVREVLVQRADRLAIKHVEEEARIEALIEQEIAVPQADEDACRRYYQSHLGRFRSADLAEARHILFVAKPDDAQAIAAARVKAQNAIELLKQCPDQFRKLAEELSDCPSSKQGGNLGQLTRGSTIPEIETFLFELEPGQLCPVPVRSRYGFHVLLLERRTNGKTLPFELVKDQIAAYLEEHVWRHAVRQYIQLLVGSSEICGIEVKGVTSPLVQ
jgi:peptidyl-prolyl cis-trans isomerase C